LPIEDYFENKSRWLLKEHDKLMFFDFTLWIDATALAFFLQPQPLLQIPFVTPNLLLLIKPFFRPNSLLSFEILFRRHMVKPDGTVAELN